jgi:hypothetical protein
VNVSKFKWTQYGFGMAVAVMFWAGATQLGLILPALECGSWTPALAIVAFTGVAVALAAAGISWRGSRQAQSPQEPGARPFRSGVFVAQVSALAALVFAYALALQGAADLVLNACDH